MYKVFTVILLVVIGVPNAAWSFKLPSKNLERSTSNTREGNVRIDLCPFCINEAVISINIILNAILNQGIMQSCGDLCAIVANDTKSKIVGDLCDVACDGFGIYEFIRLIITADLDPIWYCEMAHGCPSKQRNQAIFYI